MTFVPTRVNAAWESLAEPLPHNNITAVKAINDTNYAGSGHGTVYKSTDHGLQWRVHLRTNMGTIRGFSRTAEPLNFDNPSAHVWPRPTLTLTQADSTLIQTSPFGVARSFTWKSFQGARARIASDSRIILTSGDADIIVYNLEMNVQIPLPRSFCRAKQCRRLHCGTIHCSSVPSLR